MPRKAFVIPIDLARKTIDTDGLRLFLETNPVLLKHFKFMAELAALQIDPDKGDGWDDALEMLTEGLQDNLKGHLPGVSEAAYRGLAGWLLGEVEVRKSCGLSRRPGAQAVFATAGRTSSKGTLHD